jgi:hypothetical protein
MEMHASGFCSLNYPEKAGKKNPNGIMVALGVKKRFQF